MSACLKSGNGRCWGKQIEAEKPSVFLDADVLVAGSFSTTGASHLILRLAELGLIDAVSSAQAREEAERNLRSKLPAGLAGFRALTEAAVRWVSNADAASVERLRDQAHEKDVPILAAAVQAGCSSIVTHNVRDYAPISGSIRVNTPGDFMRQLRELLAKMVE